MLRWSTWKQRLLWEGPNPLPLSYSAKIALLTGSVYVGSLVLLHVGAEYFGITPDTIWAGRPAMQWLSIGQMALVVTCAALGTYYQLERPLRRLMRTVMRTQLSRDPDVDAVALANDTDDVGPYLESAFAEKNEALAEANRDLRDLVKELSLLYEIGQGINATIELDELFATITQMVKRHLQLHEFAILLVDENRQVLRVRAAYGFSNPERIHDMVFQMGEGVSGEVARSGRPVFIRDTRRDRRYLHYRGEHRAEGSFLSIPLRYKKEVLGVINFSRRGIASFSRNEVRFLTLVANQVALAIANARLYTQTRELSVRDDLTGLYNRRYFQQTLQVEWKRAVRFHRHLAVLMIDVDHFKRFNDTFGHLQGDQVLRQMADLLRRNLREVDTVARFGGEEFVVLLPDTDRTGASAAAEKLRHFVAQERFPLPPDQAGVPITLTVSIGIAMYPDDVREIEDLIDHADIALYEAKDTGRNRLVCYPPLDVTQEQAKPHRA